MNADVRYRPVDIVGGDYCQIRFPSSSSCYVTMCDVCGHGIGPSLLATRVSSEVRHFILDELSPVDIVRSLNTFMHDNFGDLDMFVSFLAARIDLERQSITYSGAGHPSTLHLRKPVGLVESLRSQNLLIGVEPDCLGPQPEDTRPLQRGDRLLFLTDGVTEAADARDRQLGEEGLVRIASQCLSEDLFKMADVILHHVDEFRNGPPHDDMTLVTLEIK